MAGLALAYEAVAYPHLNMSLQLKSIYTRAELEQRCKNAKRRRQLHDKLRNKSLFKPVPLKKAFESRKRKGHDPLWARPPKARAGRNVNEEASIRRKIAERMARQILEAKNDNNIDETDVSCILRTWGSNPNKARKNVSSGDPVYSDTFGLVVHRACSKPILSRLTRMYPNVARILNLWLRHHCSRQCFPATSISVNIEYRAKRHRDAGNLGPSAVKAFGPFRGGQLRIFPKDTGKGDVNKLSLRASRLLPVKRRLQYFDGRKCHEVLPFQGPRMSVVWFTSGRYSHASAATQRTLTNLGFEIPTSTRIHRAE